MGGIWVGMAGFREGDTEPDAVLVEAGEDSSRGKVGLMLVGGRARAGILALEVLEEEGSGIGLTDRRERVGCFVDSSDAPPVVKGSDGSSEGGG